MAVSDYSTTPGSNTAISGINIGEGCSPAGVNNAIRQLMADIRTFYDSVSGAGTYQPLDATLTAIAALGFTANKLMYATGSDTFAQTDITAFGRSLLAASSASDARGILDAAPDTGINGSASSGYAQCGPLVITWRTLTLSGIGSGSQTYGGNYTYTTFARAWVEGDDGIEDVSVWIKGDEMGLSSSTVRYALGSSQSIILYSIGV